MFIKKKKNKIKQKISFDADSALIDSKNLANFDQDKFEGVLERPLGKNDFIIIFIFFLLIIFFFIYKSYDFQISQGKKFAEQAKKNFSRTGVIFSERGVVFDRNQKILIWNENNSEGDFAKRNYIEKLGFAHLLGFLSYPQKDKSGVFFEKEYQGKAGIEKYFNDYLNGELGKRYIEVNAFGKIISNNLISLPRPGKNLTLSIDAEVQEKMAESLNKYIKEKEFAGGAGMLMNVENGEIIAMVSLPEFSPKIMTNISDKEKIKEYFKDKRSPFLNKALFGEYTPGSIVKPFVALAGLQEKIIWPGKKIKTNGQLVIPNPYFPDKPTIFRDWKNHGVVNMYQAIANSSNVYFYLLAGGFPPENIPGLGIKKLKKYLTDFGFGEKSGIKIFAEKKGVVPDPEWKKKAFKNARAWNIGNTYYTAIGQYGFLITPLQALVAVSAIANNGKILEPIFIKNEKPKIKKELTNIDLKNFQAVRRGMRETVLTGTNLALNLDFVQIASKSGTAEILGRERKNSWTIGFFPYQKPKYAFVFLAENGPKDVQVSVALAASWFFKELNKSENGRKYFK